jgi:gliding motility-associated lipoprotein GldH
MKKGKSAFLIKTGNKLVLIGFIFGLLLFACNRNVIYSETYEFQTKIWEIGDVKEFTFKVDKPDQLYNIYLMFDIYDDFSTNNLNLYIQSTSPSGNSEKDTVMYSVCDNTGKWFGEKSGSVIHNKFLFKKGVKLVEQGNYRIKFEHLMREENVPRIKSAGLLIETVDSKK